MRYMAERRMLGKRASLSKKLAKLQTDFARLLWTWGLPHTDDYGRFEADPEIFKAVVMPLLHHVTEEMILEAYADNHRVGLIEFREVDGCLYGEYTKFNDFQTFKKDRPRKEICPSFKNGNQWKPKESEGTLKLSKENLGLRELKLRKDVASQVSFKCPIQEKTNSWLTELANKVKSSLNQKNLGTKELQAYAGCGLVQCYHVMKRWPGDGCDKKRVEKCKKYLFICIEDLAEVVKAKKLRGSWPPAYLQGIVEKSIFEDGELFFKEKEK